ncbi:hypothetical protein LV164_008741 [Aspergillus fumigatus]|nr:hypothetical protein KXV65_004206 [Aspergillus fumigatus]KAH2117372.1 hypothetical protein KXW65_001301 [Aspergillus fumigatus]KAH2200563.1 hypothetical protein KXV88_003370 [Aspergillus fumigatus]KAH2219087.1 hypothetical protein KXV58_001584 [Aspergillus fumigatus]KAJ8154795.1 hypothetical protein LV165_006155 [Aspergillus fumigatus]
MDATKARASSYVLRGRENNEEAPVYCAFSEKEKIRSVAVASMVTFLSPVSGSIYYPALQSLSQDLGVSINTIYLTITVYMNGRRPVFVACLIVYIGVNIGLCVQDSVLIHFVLRCLQSVGSNGVSVVATATIADLITRAERGKYMAYGSLGFTFGPAVGPVLGSVLTQFLGWRSIFAFLAIVAATLLTLILAFLPETCRAIVGNGSVPAPWWNRSCLQWLRLSFQSGTIAEDRGTLVSPCHRPSLWVSIRITRQRSTGLLILASTTLSSGSTAILANIPALFEDHYRFNALQVGLCYLPDAIGALSAPWTVGTLADRNFRRCCRLAGITVARNQQTPQQLLSMPLEKARLQLMLPLVYVSAGVLTIYSWVMQMRVHVAGPLIPLFFLGNVISGARNSLAMLIIDIHAQRPATASASLAFFRSLAGAGVAAAMVPLIKAIGIAWTGTLVAATWLIVSPTIFTMHRYGHNWRRMDNSSKS